MSFVLFPAGIDYIRGLLAIDLSFEKYVVVLFFGKRLDKNWLGILVAH